MGTLKVTYAKDKSYICFSDDENRPRLMIEVSATQTEEHASVTEEILKVACKKGLDKPGVVKLRTKLLEQ